MQLFSVKAFLVANLLHIIASVAWMSFAVPAGIAALHAETFGLPIPPFPVSLTVLSWILVPVPRLLSHYFHFGPARYLYYLMLPWSVFVGVCFGFIWPHRWRLRRQMA
jgi:hypothetical protein